MLCLTLAQGSDVIFQIQRITLLKHDKHEHVCGRFTFMTLYLNKNTEINQGIKTHRFINLQIHTFINSQIYKLIYMYKRLGCAQVSGFH